MCIYQGLENSGAILDSAYHSLYEADEIICE